MNIKAENILTIVQRREKVNNRNIYVKNEKTKSLLINNNLEGNGLSSLVKIYRFGSMD